jgi:hypothetical protein
MMVASREVVSICLLPVVLVPISADRVARFVAAS